MTKYKLVHFGAGTPHMKILIVAWENTLQIHLLT